MQPIRQTADGQAIPLHQMLANGEDSSGDERYSDAREHQGDDENDLFAGTFVEAKDDSDGEDDESERQIPQKQCAHQKGVLKLTGNHQKSPLAFIKSEHEDNCGGKSYGSAPTQSPYVNRETITEISSLPPAFNIIKTNASNLSTRPRDPKEIDPQKHLSGAFRFHQKLHARAVKFKPSDPLDPRRYWIAVLDLDKKLENISSERHFTWFKGNRSTTVATIWHNFQKVVFTGDFVLLLGYEKVDFKDTMVGLDYFGDRLVCFRAVGLKHKDAKGKAVFSEGWKPKEPVVIDFTGDDD